MKVLNRVGDGLLSRLVPGIDAEANCGSCRYSHRRCGCCYCPEGLKYYERYYIDDCGRQCARQCSHVASDLCGFECC
jgi:hypothetical protein